MDTVALSEPLGVRLLGELTDPAAVELAEDTGLIQVEADARRPDWRTRSTARRGGVRRGCSAPNGCAAGQ